MRLFLQIGEAAAGVVSWVVELHQEVEVPRDRADPASILHQPRACWASHPSHAGVAGIPAIGWGRTPVFTRHLPSSRQSVGDVTWAATGARSAPDPTSEPYRPSENMSKLKEPKCGKLAEAGALPQLLQQEAEEPRQETQAKETVEAD